MEGEEEIVRTYIRRHLEKNRCNIGTSVKSHQLKLLRFAIKNYSTIVTHEVRHHVKKVLFSNILK